VSTITRQSLETRAINAIRALTIDATQEAGSGHPGMPLGAAPMGYLLFTKFLKFNPANDRWVNRDVYIQSAGHGSMLQYSLLHLVGYDLPMEELKRYRRWKSKTPGHPEHFVTPGVEVTTGPLGQGISTAVGVALAEAHLGATYNRPGFNVIDHYTYVIASDGDLMEGVSSEASSLAGHWGLGKLIVLYDDNNVTIDGKTDIAFTEDVLGRYNAYGWHTQRVEDGNDLKALEAAIHAARDETAKPSLIAVRTVIGYGAPNRQGTPKAHGSPLGEEEAQAAKAALGIDWPPFTVPDDVLEHYRQAVPRGAQLEAEWRELFERYKEAHPELAERLETALQGEVARDFEAILPRFPVGEKIATRKSSGKVLNLLAKELPQLIGGSADLAESNNTTLEGIPFLSRDDYTGRNIHFGVREHGMAAIANGLSLHGGLKPYVATFLIFSDYLRPSLRLAALMDQPVIYVFTHDSIGLGGDGPTHQPVSQLMALRAIPKLTVIRPADANETAQAWALAVTHKSPVALALTRQDVPTLEIPEGSVQRGGYVLSDCEGTPEVILIGTGSEVHKCLEAKGLLEKEGTRVRVVSLPSFELFEAQDEAYRESVLPRAVRARVSVEAGATLGWHKYVGLDGATVGLDRFGESADGDEVMDKLGFNARNIADTARKLLGSQRSA
jgi:transketolase